MAFDLWLAKAEMALLLLALVEQMVKRESKKWSYDLFGISSANHC